MRRICIAVDADPLEVEEVKTVTKNETLYFTNMMIKIEIQIRYNNNNK